MNRLPVVLVCGLPGSGKSTLIEALQKASAEPDGGRRCVRMHEEQGLDELRSRAEAGDTGYVLLEIGGLSDVESVAARMTPHSRAGAVLSQFIRLDAVVTVVDVASALRDFASWSTLPDSRPLAEVLAAQVEFADIVVLNKCGSVPAPTRQAVGVLMRALNPDVGIIETEGGEVPADRLLFTHAFEFTRAQGRARWARMLSGDEESHSDAHGISAFRYTARRPFHPERFMHFVRSAWPGAVRSRGFFWLASRMDSIGELSQAGASRRFRSVGAWWATVSEERGAGMVAELEALAGVPWDASYGDRRQEIAFVGVDMNEAALRRRLDECLLDDGEFGRGREVWQSYCDPFPAWHFATLPRPAAFH